MSHLGKNMQGRGMALPSLIGCLFLFAPLFLEVAIAGPNEIAVGGSAGWTLPTIGNINYTAWESSHTFVVDDILVFNYSREYHNVIVVTKADYEACDASNPIAAYDDGMTTLPLYRSGTFFFICGVPSHCEAGQKVAIRVRKHPRSASQNNTSPTESPTSSPTSFFIPISTPSPNPPNENIGAFSRTYNIFLVLTLIFALAL